MYFWAVGGGRLEKLSASTVHAVNPYRRHQPASKPCLPISRCGNFSRAAGPRKRESRRGIHQTNGQTTPPVVLETMRKLPSCQSFKTQALPLPSIRKKSLLAALQSHKLLQTHLPLLVLKGLPPAQTLEPKGGSQPPLFKRP